MDRNDVFQKMTDICKEIFNVEDLALTDESSAADIEQWDSLTHLSIISDTEDEFGISFTLEEINSKNFGELVNAVVKHLNEK